MLFQAVIVVGAVVDETVSERALLMSVFRRGCCKCHCCIKCYCYCYCCCCMFAFTVCVMLSILHATRITVPLAAFVRSASWACVLCLSFWLLLFILLGLISGRVMCAVVVVVVEG